ncbi:iron chelate uptake ABC transporter family permease subunit [Aureimonas jatrophae]|uniref:Iron complex transport system permease protein n=1 Tax=Aureimonas jatrophae TaxID=1166073 RepID=A0A1H0L5D1_9HYPH|nr:iron chelate uptake ABC transporter family permease subunit [Aureimonas jatrophae]MBB3952412.1 iron complex transport system permease protein [Aureimonas jatrophae]SDO63282.1 iron complex transport system permease protein [Aureimonas jatrophae]
MSGSIRLLALLLVAVLVSLAMGETLIGLGALGRGLLFGEGPGALAIRVIRGPRLATALGAGAALGLSGAVLQTLLRNPLASPDILGFNAGAGLAVVAAITLGWTLPPPLVAALGGIASALLVAALAHRPGRSDATLVLVLVGLGVGFTLAALTNLLSLRLPSTEAAEAQRWVTGSLAARNWGHALQVWLPGLALALLLALQVGSLQLLELGPELARGLGLRVEAARLALVGTAVLLAAAGVAVAGPVAFVALMAMPLGRRITGARGTSGRLLSAAGGGALVMVLADLAGRVALPGVQLPVGVTTGALGAPYLLWRLAREMDRGEL